MKPSSQIVDWVGLADLVTKAARKSLKPDCASALSNLLTRSLCDVARTSIALLRGEFEDGLDEEGTRNGGKDILQSLFGRIQKLLAFGAWDADLRFAHKLRNWSQNQLRLVSFNEAFVSYKDLLLESLLDRHCPDWRLKPDGISFCELNSDVYAAIRNDLARRNVPRGFSEVALSIALGDASLRANHLIVISVSKGEEADYTLDTLTQKTFEASLRGEDPLQIVQLWGGVYNELRSHIDSGEALPSPSEPETPKLHGRWNQFLVTSPQPWQNLLAHVAEHWQDFDDQDGQLDEPPRWGWLCENSHYLIVTRWNGVCGVASYAVQSTLRLLIALSRCLRAGSDATRHVLVDAGIFWIGWDSDTPASCRFISVPLDKPPVCKRSSFKSLADHGVVWQAEIEYDEFRLAGRPFVNADDLDNEELSRVWHWFAEDGPEQRRICELLELFETAQSIGGGKGDIGPDFEAAWLVVANVMCLESTVCRASAMENRTQVLDAVHHRVLKAGYPEPIALQCRSTVNKAYDARNAILHAGRIEFISELIEELPTITAIVLRHEIQRVVPDRKP